MKRAREEAAKEIIRELAPQGIPWRGEIDAILPVLREQQKAAMERLLRWIDAGGWRALEDGGGPDLGALLDEETP